MKIGIESNEVLGLKPNESKILDAISSKELSISEISRKTRIPRTSLLFILNKLKDRTLVQIVKNGKRSLWKSNLNESITDFKRLHNYTEYYKGKDELMTIINMIPKLPKYSRILGIQPQTSLRFAMRKLPYDKILEINNIVKKNKLIFEGIVHEESIDSISYDFKNGKAKEIFESFTGRLEDYVKIPHEFANVDSEMYIFSGSAYIINWNKEIAIGIHDSSIVLLLTAMFSCVKNFGMRYQQGKKMMEIITPPNKLR
jgi:hypothetical protein